MAFNARKAAQTIAYFVLKNSASPLDVIKAVKLVYLADRESIKLYGFPIQDEDRVSMKHGPVNSETYSCINGEQDLAEAGWADFLRDKADHKIALADKNISSDDLDELSDADIGVLDAVWSQFGHMNKWDLCDWTHESRNVPEWENPGNSSWPIPMERIMTHVGIPNAQEQAEIVRDFDRLDEMFRDVHRLDGMARIAHG